MAAAIVLVAAAIICGLLFAIRAQAAAAAGLEMVLGLFGNSTGLFGVTPLGMLTAFGGLILGIFMLILDFDFVERGIRAGLPERESWRAAFGLTVTIIWIYIELLRILAILRGND